MMRYYIKQFSLYYAGMTGAKMDEFVFSNSIKDAVMLTSRALAEKKCDELGNDDCEIIEHII